MRVVWGVFLPNVNLAPPNISESGSSSQSTVNRKSKLGLLFKQYYEEPSQVGGESWRKALEYSIERLKKLKTEPLMSKAVESLRSYKEAESELRMLLYNNCDKLLEAVQVVVDIRSGSNDLVARAHQLVEASEHLADRRTPDEGMAKLHAAMDQKAILEKVEAVLKFPEILQSGIQNATSPASSLLKQYLRVKSEFFALYSRRFVLVNQVADQCLKIVESQLVPVLMEEVTDKGGNFKLILEMYPEGHPRHAEAVGRYLEVELMHHTMVLADRRLAFISSAPVACSECLSTFNAVITTLFLAPPPTVGIIQDDLLPLASSQIRDAVRLDEKFVPNEMADFIQNATAAHSRIPGVARSFVSSFRRSCCLAYVEGRLLHAARTVVQDDLPSLLASSSFGPCCDVIHTRCCTVVVEAHAFLSAVEEVGELSDFVLTILALIRRYYETVLVPEWAQTWDLALLLKLVKMNKFVLNRETISRSTNSLVEIFNFNDEYEELGAVSAAAMLKLVKLTAVFVGSDFSKLKLAIDELSNVLESGSSGNSAAATIGRFGRRTSTVDLQQAETVHSRKLVFPPTPEVVTIEFAVFVMACIFLRTKKERMEGGSWEEDQFVNLADSLLSNTGYMGTIQAMLADLDGGRG